jgi:hypothetical protein
MHMIGCWEQPDLKRGLGPLRTATGGADGMQPVAPLVRANLYRRCGLDLRVSRDGGQLFQATAGRSGWQGEDRSALLEERGPITGRFQPVAAKSALEAEHPQGRAVARLRMGPVAHQPLDQDSDVIAHSAPG